MVTEIPFEVSVKRTRREWLVRNSDGSVVATYPINWSSGQLRGYEKAMSQGLQMIIEILDREREEEEARKNRPIEQKLLDLADKLISMDENFDSDLVEIGHELKLKLKTGHVFQQQSKWESIDPTAGVHAAESVSKWKSTQRVWSMAESIPNEPGTIFFRSVPRINLSASSEIDLAWKKYTDAAGDVKIQNIFTGRFVTAQGIYRYSPFIEIQPARE